MSKVRWNELNMITSLLGIESSYAVRNFITDTCSFPAKERSTSVVVHFISFSGWRYREESKFKQTLIRGTRKPVYHFTSSNKFSWTNVIYRVGMATKRKPDGYGQPDMPNSPWI